MKSEYFNFAELIEWGYQTGGDFDEALRIYTEHNRDVAKEVTGWSDEQLASIENRFHCEFIGGYDGYQMCIL